MTTPRRIVLPTVVSLTCGLSATVLMFTLPGDAAAPAQLSYASSASGELLRINKLDLDMTGGAQSLDLAVGRAAGQTGATASPRSRAQGTNVVGSPTPAGQKTATSDASDGADTVGATTVAGSAGTVPQQLDFGASTMTARGRWAGDSSCLAVAAPLTSSKATVQGAGIVPAPIPEGQSGDPTPFPTGIPTELPTALPSDFPTGLPSDLPSPTVPTVLPTLPSPTLTTDVPTVLPTSGLPTVLPTSGLPTVLPTSGLPTVLPTSGLPTILPTTVLPTLLVQAPASRAAGDVSMAGVAPATTEEKTSLLDFGTSGLKQVQSEATGTLAAPSAPAMTFFGGEVELRLSSAPRLTAYSTGTANGSQVEWTPPQMTLTVGGVDYAVPTDGTALAVPYSKNKDVVLTVSAGRLSSAESTDGTLAQAAVTTLDVLIKNGDTVALDADLFPLAVRAAAPQGGIVCPTATPAPAKRTDPKVKVAAHSKGAKPDKLVVKAATRAARAGADVYRVVKGKKKKVASGRLNRKGDHTFTIKDRNGKKTTKYVIKVHKTSLTTAGQGVRKVR